MEAAIMGGRKYSVSARNIFAFEWRIVMKRKFFWKLDQGFVEGTRNGIERDRALSIQSLAVAPLSDEIPIFR